MVYFISVSFTRTVVSKMIAYFICNLNGNKNKFKGSNRLQAVLYEFYILFNIFKLMRRITKKNEKKNSYIFKIPKGQKSHLNTGLT